MDGAQRKIIAADGERCHGLRPSPGQSQGTARLWVENQVGQGGLPRVDGGRRGRLSVLRSVAVVRGRPVSNASRSRRGAATTTMRRHALCCLVEALYTRILAEDCRGTSSCWSTIEFGPARSAAAVSRAADWRSRSSPTRDSDTARGSEAACSDRHPSSGHIATPRLRYVFPRHNRWC